MPCSTIWGTKSIQQFRQVRGNYQCIIGFNECNLGSQANLSPTDAARIWNQEVGWLAKKGVVLVGPSVTTAPNGFQWMIDFFNACGNANGPHCGVSMINLHYYGTNVQDFISYMTKFYNKFHLPIMVTEFACTDFSGRVHPSPAQVRAFMAGVISWMESTSWITGYCAFGITDGSLWGVSENARMLSGPSTLNSLGRAYVEGTWV
ncbi:uncharacterized protein EI90DRAFT_3051408 [Cantharellus anzutake]|uniref:uncharacterized protein n=1 Tax=Cantharellus anzutake TaxID=1750568 RepID=UPI001908DFAB|nr:uncharacterized protein EI90DRAFT_3051408 [Cantharellus anzutake]KAF8334186.1 hypothetical protein EI90DRAFT_3051408 [Cantharellus anzutake]